MKHTNTHTLERGITMRNLAGSFACGFALLVLALTQASAQSPSLIQIPNVSVAVGIPVGQTQTPCSTSIPQTDGGNYGDGCPPTQALLNTVDATATDSYGNVYFGDNGHASLRVIYKGNPALAAAIVASYSNAAKVSASTIKVGDVYTLVGGCSSATSGCYAEVTAAGGIGNTTILNGVAGIAIDADGNVFFSEGNRIRIFYVAGTAAVSLLKSAGQAVAAGQPGYQYTLLLGGSATASNTAGYNGDGGPASAALVDAPHGLAVDASENLYIADYYNRVVRKITASTGKISSFAGGLGCVEGTDRSCTDASGGDGGPAFSTSTGIATPSDVALDANGNLFISEYDPTGTTSSQKVRAVYLGAGTLPNVSTPVTGDIYTVAGGSLAATASGVAALSAHFSTITGIGFDAAQNLYVVDKGNHLWEIEHTTQIALIIGGGGAATVAGSPCVSTNAAGAKATDTVGDGCTGTQSILLTPSGHVSVDAQGGLYVGDYGDNLLRYFSRTNLFAQTSTGSTATTQTYGFDSLATATLGAVGLGVQGIATGDFADAGSSTCVAALALTPGKTCLLNVKFSPLLSGQRDGYIAFTNSSATGIGSFFVGGSGSGAETAVDTGTQTSVGTGLAPRGIATDAAGNLYIADGTSSSLLKYTSSTATTPSATLITGLSSPAQVAVDGEGNVAVADPGHNRIAIYNHASASVSFLTTGLSAPQGVTIDPSGDYFVADTGNSRIVEFLAAGGTHVVPSTVAGPTRLTLDAAGDLYIVDAGNSRIVKIPSANGTQSTVSTLSYTPADVALDAAGDLYLLDSGGDQVGVISPSGSTYTLLTGLKQPSSLAVDALGDVFVADSMIPGAFAINRQSMTIDFGNVNLNSTSAASSFMLTAIGDQAVQFTNPSVVTATGNTTVFTQNTGSNACTSPFAAGSRCGYSYSFTPAATGSYNSTLTFPSNASSADATTVKLQGTGVQLNNTAVSITLTSPTNASTLTYGTPLTVSISLKVLTGTGTPTGSFTILLNGVKQNTVSIGSGTVTYTFTPQAGSVAVTAVYSGDNSFASSNGTLNLNIAPVPTTTTLAITNNLSATPPSLLLTAQVASAIAGVGGTVDFYNGQTLLGSATTNTQGIATFTVNNPVLTNFTFSATYVGNSDYATSTSSTQTLATDFAFTPSLQMSAVQGGIATGNFTLTPYFGFTGTIQFSCAGLPTDANCRPFPQTVSFNETNNSATTVQLQIFTGVNPSTAQQHEPAFPFGRPGTILAALAGLCFFRRRKFARRPALLAAMFALLLTSLSGCSSGTPSSPTYSTPAGVYQVAFTATSSTGVRHTSNISLIVQAK